MSNIVYKGKEARARLLNGMKEVYDAVKPSFGANGRNGVYNKWTKVPVATNDGLNIAREVDPEEPSDLQGANLMKQVAESTNAELEDSSTSTILHSYILSKKGVDLVDSSKKISPMKLRKEMKIAAKKVVDEIEKVTTKIRSIEDLESLAKASVESEEYGRIIAKGIFEAGDNGILYVNESDKIGISLEKVEGYQFNQGMISLYLISNPERMESILDDAAVLVTDLQLSITNEFLKLMEDLERNNCKNVLIVCDEIHPDVIKFSVMNRLKNKINIAIVKKPMQAEYLEDIAATVGATAMTGNKGMVHPKIDYVGRAKKVCVNRKTTTLFIDDSMQDGINKYVLNLQSQLSLAEDEISKTKLSERIARLTGGVFLLNVGEKTEASMKYLRDKVDDAVNSLKKVWKQRDTGFLVGGGMTLYRIGKKLLEQKDITYGERVVYESCETTLLQLLENGGEDPSMLQKINESEAGGYNALTMEFEPDMVKARIRDAAKVVITSFVNCVDFAADVVTYEILITPLPEKETGLVK